jgi:ferrous iron transport protein A
MKGRLIPLHQLPIGSAARVRELIVEGNIRRRMLDLGLVYDTQVEAMQRSPSGDPTAYQIRGAVIALRSEEASKILVQETEGSI